MIKLKYILTEKFNDILHQIGKDKNDWADISNEPAKGLVKKDIEAKQNIFDLIDGAYRTELNEPHVGIQSPNDILSFKYDYWEAIDIDENPDAEAVLFGKKQHGIKLSGLGHNGEKLSKKTLLNKQLELLKKPGYWVESSGKAAQVKIISGAPIFKDKEKIQKLFPESKFQWNEDYSYIRTLEGNKVTDKEYIFGNPKI